MIIANDLSAKKEAKVFVNTTKFQLGTLKFTINSSRTLNKWDETEFA